MNSSSDIRRRARRAHIDKPIVTEVPAPWWLQLICFGVPAAIFAACPYCVYHWVPSVANKIASLW